MRKNFFKYFSLIILFSGLFTACVEDVSDEGFDELNPNGLADEYFTGGLLGTTSINGPLCFEQPTAAVSNAGLSDDFIHGEGLFEDYFTDEKNADLDFAMQGLGPLYIRSACIDCHPGYGHGKRMGNLGNNVTFDTSNNGNGYLLVIYYDAGGDGFGADDAIEDSTTITGPTWTSNADNDAYCSDFTGMPQTQSITPFPAPLDEDKILIEWKEFEDEWGNEYADGKSYQLIYPEVTIQSGAVYNNYADVSSYKVKLEATIGIYGTGLIDAITEEDIDAEAEAQAGYYWGGRRGASIKQLDGTTRKGRYTYALSRGTLQHGPGSNALWNITNVTRDTSNKLYRTNYCTPAYANAVIADEDVMQALKDDSYYSFLIGEDAITSDAAKNRVYNYLMFNNTYSAAKITGQNDYWSDIEDVDETHYLNFVDTEYQRDAEISLADYTQFMVWHRGLAVPSARNIDTDEYKLGKELFYSDQLGCTGCHRPSWTTGSDKYVGDADMDGKLPTYANQKIWPYSDFLQHNLGMENNIRTGWCRTTPLWGRYLNKVANGESSHLHDMRARDYYEAIMWHKGQGYYSSSEFRKLNETQRDAVVFFLQSI